MEYPIYLLPKVGDGCVELNSEIQNCVFARRAKKGGSIIDSSTGRIKREMLLGDGETGQMKDLSLNLLGEHSVEDCYWNIISEKNYFHDYWDFKRECSSPSEGDVDKFDSSSINVIYFIFRNDDFPIGLGAENKECTANLVHRPTLCNYWHFQLEVIDKDGNLISSNTNSNKKMLKLFIYDLLNKWTFVLPSINIDSEVALRLRLNFKVSLC